MIAHTDAVVLMDLYKELLTPRQQEILSLYFEEDLSLSEIQENLKISRAAALNAIQKGVAAMEKYDSILQLRKKSAMLEALATEHPELEQQIQIILDL